MCGRNVGQTCGIPRLKREVAGRIARQGFLWVLLVALGVGCASYPRSDNRVMLARVNGQEITLKQVKERFQGSHRGLMSLLLNEPGLTRFINREIERRLLVEEAKRIGLDKDPELVEAVQEYKRTIISLTFYRDEVQSQISVSEEELKTFHSKLGEKVRVSLILVPTRAEAEQIREMLTAGTNFAQLAKERSLGRNAEKGGDLGVIGRGDLGPALENAAFSLPEGETSQVVATSKGYGILQVKKRLEVQLPDFSQVRPWMKKVLASRKGKILKKAFLDKLWAWQEVKIDRQLVKPGILEDKVQEGAIVARLGDSRISVGQLKKRLRSKGLAKFDVRVSAEQIGLFLKEMIDAELIFQEARAKGYEKKEEILAQVRKKEEQLILRRLYQEVIFAGIVVGEEEVKRYYQEHRDRLMTPEKVLIGHILIKTEEEARQMLDSIRSGASFEELARDKSLDQITANRGGRVGWITRAQAAKAWKGLGQKVFALAPGEVSEPLASAKGIHLVKVWKKRKPKDRPFEVLAGSIRRELLREKRQTRKQAWLNKLKSQTQISLDKAAIAEAATILKGEIESSGPSSARPSLEVER